MRPGNKAWLALGGFVLGWNVSCEDGETLSEAADDWPRILAIAIVVAVGGHVANLIPERWDVLHRAHIGIRALHVRLPRHNPSS